MRMTLGLEIWTWVQGSRDGGLWKWEVFTRLSMISGFGIWVWLGIESYRKVDFLDSSATSMCFVLRAPNFTRSVTQPSTFIVNNFPPSAQDSRWLFENPFHCLTSVFPCQIIVSLRLFQNPIDHQLPLTHPNFNDLDTDKVLVPSSKPVL